MKAIIEFQVFVSLVSFGLTKEFSRNNPAVDANFFFIQNKKKKNCWATVRLKRFEKIIDFCRQIELFNSCLKFYFPAEFNRKLNLFIPANRVEAFFMIKYHWKFFFALKYHSKPGRRFLDGIEGR